MSVVVYLYLFIPFAPPEYRTMLYRLPDAGYATVSDCQEESPRDVALWLEEQEKAGRGSIHVRNIICFRTEPDYSS